MSVDVNGIVNKALKYGYGLTPVPSSLTVGEEDVNYYCFYEVADGSSLVWVDVLQDVFNDAFGTVNAWTVDDPGVLYNQEDEDSASDMEKMQEAADEALRIYATVFEKLKNQGVQVEDN